MKSDLRDRLEVLVTQLQDMQFFGSERVLKDEAHQVALDLKHIIDFVLPPKLQVLSTGFRLLYCKQCGTCCVRPNEPDLLVCPGGHPLSYV